ncbi:transcriptional regulator [Streptomyces sp. RKAG290]|uniref:winged helix-turn-helix domain-containing protein n=1 Tax=Streptomyces sp. RKAG290 TaxID=2888348 RepID=UPI00203420AF|nr:transcriptional regulator [Streptomyces sp. RKAG290]MCM2413543.1 transcriptional regulator [Streptomyces sp. RKAG290]
MNGDPPRGERAALDETIHNPTRLAVVAFLSACDEAEFATVRDGCQVSDSVLSKTASALEAAGYVDVRKGHVGKRPRTWLSLTPVGQEALAQHIAALQDIVATARSAGAGVDTGTDVSVGAGAQEPVVRRRGEPRTGARTTPGDGSSEGR